MLSISKSSIISLILLFLSLTLLSTSEANPTPRGSPYGSYGRSRQLQRGSRGYRGSRRPRPVTDTSSIISSAVETPTIATSAIETPSAVETSPPVETSPAGETPSTEETEEPAQEVEPLDPTPGPPGPILPDNGAGLPAPSEGLVRKIVAVGQGTQNYTCANATSVPVAAGAVAGLFDAASLSNFPRLLNTITSDAVTGPPDLPQLGSHYFNAEGVPTFDMGAAGLFIGGKLAGVPAPADANPGASNEGAVDWLKLGDKGTSVGLKEAYRVETAGGKPPASCEGQEPVITVEYATQYIFFG